MFSKEPEFRMIAALRGAPSARIQQLMAEFAAKLGQSGFRVGGVVEIAEVAPTGVCGQSRLRDLSTGEEFSISQNLGPGSEACNLDGRGLAAACAAVERALAGGLDLVILSKFGKQEAARSGLNEAYQTAAASRTPLLTAVSPAMAEAWGAFAGPLSQYLPASAEAVEAWWSSGVARASGLAAE
jgi:nucleoside-triphosphatase THEP1